MELKNCPGRQNKQRRRTRRQDDKCGKTNDDGPVAEANSICGTDEFANHLYDAPIVSPYPDQSWESTLCILPDVSKEKRLWRGDSG